jgi:hypothetical protein
VSVVCAFAHDGAIAAAAIVAAAALRNEIMVSSSEPLV